MLHLANIGDSFHRRYFKHRKVFKKAAIGRKDNPIFLYTHIRETLAAPTPPVSQHPLSLFSVFDATSPDIKTVQTISIIFVILKKKWSPERYRTWP